MRRETERRGREDEEELMSEGLGLDEDSLKNNPPPPNKKKNFHHHHHVQSSHGRDGCYGFQFCFILFAYRVSNENLFLVHFF